MCRQTAHQNFIVARYFGKLSPFLSCNSSNRGSTPQKRHSDRVLSGMSARPFSISYATQEQAKVYAERAEVIENEMETKLSKAKASLEESTTRLVGRTANSAKVGTR